MKKKSIIFVVIIGILLIWVGILSSQINEYKKANENINDGIKTYQVSGFSTDLTEVSKKVKGNTVTVLSLDKVSSGFIYRKNNNDIYIVTCAHSIVGDKTATVVLDNGLPYSGEVIGTDPFSDIAILKIEEDIIIPETALGDSQLLKDGEFLLCIGTPTSTEFKNSINFAIVSSKLRTVLNSITFEKETYNYYTSQIQLSSSVNLGYSGSPCFNMAGEVVGVITMKAYDEVMAVPINEIKIIADKIIENGHVNKTQLGIKEIYINDLETYEKTNMGISLDVTSGIYVSQIQNNSLAKIFGIQINDVITEINSTKINNNNDFLKVMYEDSKEFTFTVVRNNETLTIKGSIDD